MEFHIASSPPTQLNRVALDNKVLIYCWYHNAARHLFQNQFFYLLNDFSLKNVYVKINRLHFTFREAINLTDVYKLVVCIISIAKPCNQANIELYMI